MKNVYQGSVIKLIGKVILTAALYSIAYRLSKKIWGVKNENNYLKY